MITMSAALPGSRDPLLVERPREAAALMVAATSASGMDMCSNTHARCMTRGWEGGKAQYK